MKRPVKVFFHTRYGVIPELGKPIAKAKTAPAYYRVQCAGGYIAMCPGGHRSVAGEIYKATPEALKKLDESHHHPSVYGRKTIVLDDGTKVFAYVAAKDMLREHYHTDEAWAKSRAEWAKWMAWTDVLEDMRLKAEDLAEDDYARLSVSFRGVLALLAAMEKISASDENDRMDYDDDWDDVDGFNLYMRILAKEKKRARSFAKKAGGECKACSQRHAKLLLEYL